MGEAAGSLAATGQRDFVVSRVPVYQELAEGVAEDAHRRLARTAAGENVSDKLLLRLVAGDEGPEPGRSRLPLVLHALGRLVGKNDLLLCDELQEPVGERSRELRRAAKQVAERRIVHLYADAPIRLGLAVQRQRVGALRDGDLGHERRPEPCFVVDTRWPIGGDDSLATAAAQLLLDVSLPLDPARNELVDLRRSAVAEPGELVAPALRADLLVLADLVLDPPRGEQAAFLGVLASLLLRGDSGRLCVGWVADGLLDRRHLLRSLSEDVPLQLLQRALDRRDLVGKLVERGAPLGDRRPRGGQLSDGGGELCLEALGLVTPLATMLVAHPRSYDHDRIGLSILWPGSQGLGRRTRPKSMPSRSIASCVASISTAIEDGSMWGSLNWPRSRRL